MFVCCVVPKYVGVVIIYAPLAVGSSPSLCSCVVYHSMCVCIHRTIIISCIIDGNIL